MKKAKKDTFSKMGIMAEKRANVKHAQSMKKEFTEPKPNENNNVTQSGIPNG